MMGAENAPTSKLRPIVWLALPAASVIALVVHWLAAQNELPPETRLYNIFL